MNDSKFHLIKTEEDYKKQFSGYDGSSPTRYPCIGYLEYISGGIVGDYYKFLWYPVPSYLTKDIDIGIYITGFADGYEGRSV